MTDNRATLVIAIQDLATRGLTAFAGRLDKLRADLENARGFLAGVAGAMGLLGGAALRASGQFQQWQVAFSTMLGSTERATDLLGRLREFAARTPFELPEVVEGGKRLMAFGVSAEEVIPTLRALGDAAAGLGVPVDRLVNAFGQVKAAGRLMGQEVLQFTNAGLPILDMLSKRFGVTTGAVKKMVEEGKVGFEDVRAVLFAATQQGGIFFNMMESQSHTLFGRVNELRDSFFKLAMAIGEILLPYALELVNRAITLVTTLARLAEENRTLTAALVGLGVVVGVVSGGLLALGFALPAVVAGLGAIQGIAGTLGLSLAGLTASAAATNQMLGVTAVAAGGVNVALLALAGTIGVTVAAVGGLALGLIRAAAAADEADASFRSHADGQRRVQAAMERGFETSRKYASATAAQMRANSDAAATYVELTKGINGLLVAMEQAKDPAADQAIAERIKHLRELRDALNLPAAAKGEGPDDDAGRRLADQVRQQMEIEEAHEVWRDNIQAEHLAARLAAYGEHQLARELLVRTQAQTEVELARRAGLEAERIQQARNRSAMVLLTQLSTFQTAKTKELAAVGKAAAFAMTIINAHKAAGEAMAAFAAIPPLALAMGALMEAAGMAQAAQIAGVPLAQGGVALPVPGGTLARIAEAGGKEAVLPLDDKRAMESIREGLGSGGPQNVFNVGTLIADELSLDEFARRLDSKLYQLRRNRESAQ